MNLILLLVLILTAILGLTLIINWNSMSFQRIFARSRKKLNRAETSASSRTVTNTSSDLQKSIEEPQATRIVTNTSSDLQKSIEKLQVARQQLERIGKLRHLDIQIAEAFLLYVSIQWGRNYSQPTGIPRTHYDYHRSENNLFRETIPRYSTNQSDYFVIERSAIELGLHDLFLRILAEEELNETTATLEQKCIVWLKVRTEERKRRRNRENEVS